MARKPTEAASEKVGQDDAFTLGEIGNQKVEQASEKMVKNESFGNEILTIVVHADRQEGSLDVITVVCNGVNQQIVRGREQNIKRKYVEILARSRITEYDQLTQDPSEPANIQMIPKTNLTYPFAVVHDPFKDGREWLNNILAQP